jgi:hypothetical protein
MDVRVTNGLARLLFLENMYRGMVNMRDSHCMKMHFRDIQSKDYDPGWLNIPWNQETGADDVNLLLAWKVSPHANFARDKDTLTLTLFRK